MPREIPPFSAGTSWPQHPPSSSPGPGPGSLPPLQRFALAFFSALGTPVQVVEPDLWQVDLTGEQRALIAPLSTVPWWASPPTPPETVRWWIAFSREAAEKHPEARLLTPHSQLFHQLRETCRRHGMAYTGTLWHPHALGYRPLLGIHLMITRRAPGGGTRLESWVCDLVRGTLRRRPLPPLARLRPGSPPPGAPIERSRVSPLQVWQRIVSSVLAHEARTHAPWTEAAHRARAEERREVEAYYDAWGERGEAKAGGLPAQERDRRLQEVDGRHFPVLFIEPVAATLVYVPVDYDDGAEEAAFSHG